MIREFVGFNAYEAACERDTGLLGWRPCDTAEWFGISDRDVLRAVQDGVLDLCRIVRRSGSVQILIPLYSVRAFHWPYEVVAWTRRKQKRGQLASWQLLMLQADVQRGSWRTGVLRAS